jgi:hypothetical protein
MPALKNPRHELFAQLIVEGKRHGWSNGACYSRAGYKSEAHAAEAAASRLLKNVENGIAGRVQEIVGKGAKRAEVTVQSLLSELDEVLAGAVGEKQYGAARAAIDSKARLKGLFIDKVEIGGAGEFARLDSPQAVVDALLSDIGDPQAVVGVLDLMRRLVEQKAANMALDITPPVPVPPKTRGEAAMAIESLRPWKRH